MKTNLTVTIDEDLVLRAERYARRQGVSLSSLIESTLTEMMANNETAPFSERCRGAMVRADRDDQRDRALFEKYG